MLTWSRFTSRDRTIHAKFRTNPSMLGSATSLISTDEWHPRLEVDEADISSRRNVNSIIHFIHGRVAKKRNVGLPEYNIYNKNGVTFLQVPPVYVFCIAQRRIRNINGNIIYPFGRKQNTKLREKTV